MKKSIFLLTITLSLIFSGCYPEKRECKDFKTGHFVSEYEIDGKIQKTTFQRNDSLEISEFNSKIDTASIRWINDCEYILQKLNPKNIQEGKAVHIKLLTTTENGYDFQFSIVGSSNKMKGSVSKIE